MSMCSYKPSRKYNCLCVTDSSCDCSDSCSCCSNESERSQRISPPPLPVLPPPRQKVKFSNTVTHIQLPSQVRAPTFIEISTKVTFKIISCFLSLL